MGEVEERVLAAGREMDAMQDSAGGLIELGTGVVLRPLALNSDTYTAIMARFKEIPVPTVYDPERGRHIPNPDDPVYMAEVNHQKVEFAEALTLACYAMGVEIVSIPDGFPGPDDEDWLDLRAVSGLSSGDSRRARLMDWLRHRATVNTPDRKPKDNARIMRAVGRASGTTEADVAEATKSTGRDEGRRTADGRGDRRNR